MQNSGFPSHADWFSEYIWHLVQGHTSQGTRNVAHLWRKTIWIPKWFLLHPPLPPKIEKSILNNLQEVYMKNGKIYWSCVCLPCSYSVKFIDNNSWNFKLLKNESAVLNTNQGLWGSKKIVEFSTFNTWIPTTTSYQNKIKKKTCDKWYPNLANNYTNKSKYLYYNNTNIYITITQQ